MAVSVLSLINELIEKRHSLKCKLYPNHLKDADGRWFARPVMEATQTPKELVAALKNRTGYDPSTTLRAAGA
jgi:uncharacterized protein YdeI (YjbR/CyaY-like superfamily)